MNTLTKEELYESTKGHYPPVDWEDVAKLRGIIDRLSARVEELSRQRDEQYQSFLLQRGVEIPCKRCSGLGVAVYGDSSTWRRGGCAGQVITSDICDLCWGTGDANRKGADLKAINGKINSLLKAVEPFLKEMKMVENWKPRNESKMIVDYVTNGDLRNLNSVVQKIKGEKK